LAVHGSIEERMMRQFLTAVAVAALAACTTSNPDVVHRYQTQRLSHV